MIYKHDCNECRFLGTTIGGGRLVDLYVHEYEDRPQLSTLIARYGNEGPEYYSGIPSTCFPNGHAELFAALKLYEQEGKSCTSS